MRTKLQLALDMLSLEEAVSIADATRAYVDIIEVGTPLLKYQGVRAISTLKERFGDKPLFADAKSIDVGEYEADFCYQAGADVVSVLGVADDETIRGAVRSARRHGCTVLVDLINVANKIGRARDVERLGAHIVCVHSGIDQQCAGKSLLDDLRQVRAAVTASTSVAGGITLATIREIVNIGTDVVVVGGAITSSRKPAEVAARLKSLLTPH